MYLSTLKLWNFRKFGLPGEINIKEPHLCAKFKPGLNVLVGENDSGKTAIIDAIKLVLKTHAYDWIRPTKEDFHDGASIFRIELEVDGLTDIEASHFVEWLGWRDDKPYLRIIYQSRIKDGVIFSTDVKAGQSDDGIQLSLEAREYLKTTYLRPLRDANNELTAGKNSRISQILKGHSLLQKVDGLQHPLETIAETSNEAIKDWFFSEEGGVASNKSLIIDVVDGFLHSFINDGFSTNISLVPGDIKTILEKLSLEISEDKHLGLGTMNRLYMAAELLHLKQPGKDKLNLCMIEELEAHLHPQSQLKVISSLQALNGIQFLLTTHSPNITSKLRFSNPGVNLLMCKGVSIFSLSEGETKLTKADYSYLETFLDVTRSSLFFTNGLFLVEGWAEEIILPALALKMGHDFTKEEISVINVGSTAYLRFAHIFMPVTGQLMGVKVAAITDLDVQPKDGVFDAEKESEKKARKESNFADANDEVKLFIANQWTLEWCLFSSPATKNLFMDAVATVYPGIVVFQKKRVEGCDDLRYDEGAFKSKLIEKLLPGSSSPFDKVRVAYAFAHILSDKDVNIELSEEDAYISYLVKAINHVCPAIPDGD